MTATLPHCPMKPDGEPCPGRLHMARDEDWLEYSCDECGYQACRHVDSTGPVREQDQTGNDNTESHWWDR